MTSWLKLRLAWQLSNLDSVREDRKQADRRAARLKREQFDIMDKIDELRKRINAGS